MRVLIFVLLGCCDAMFASLLRDCWTAVVSDSENSDDEHLPERYTPPSELRANLLRFKQRLDATMITKALEVKIETVEAVEFSSPVTDREDVSPRSPRLRASSDSIPIPKRAFSVEAIAATPILAFSPGDRRRTPWSSDLSQSESPAFTLPKHMRGASIVVERTTTVAPAEDEFYVGEDPSESENSQDNDFDLFLGDLE